ncbi:MAG: SulP family inorganic anion transporter [Myxococcota bacterium]
MKRPTLPLPRVQRYRRASLWPDLSAATTVLFLAVPQGLAYATIAGLPPAMGLYAAAIPTIVGSVFRSSSHVLSGPTNALSLLVGGATAVGLGADPAAVAITLALMVGVMQIAAGLLRLGTLVDYISSAVVLGYITGAAALIAVGQLHNLTGTRGPSGRIWEHVGGWLPQLALHNRRRSPEAGSHHLPRLVQGDLYRSSLDADEELSTALTMLSSQQLPLRQDTRICLHTRLRGLPQRQLVVFPRISEIAA